MQITKIVITGGPCAGKTTALKWVKQAFEARGYTVLVIAEGATELINGGVAPWTCGSVLDFQQYLMRLQLQKEATFEAAARGMRADKILIVCDRGAVDSLGYLTVEERRAALAFVGVPEVELRDTYDGVFHLMTTAKGAGEFYTTANNQARTETPQQAISVDDRLISVWVGHPHLRLIDNFPDIAVKMQRLIDEIAGLLGDPVPMEIERKFLIARPDEAFLESLPNCKRVDIVQTYLTAPEGEERRVRKRGRGDDALYYLTVKRRGEGIGRVEQERRITQEEYLAYLTEADPERRPIEKKRYCLAQGTSYYEIDVYPFWKDTAILEIELLRENEPVDIPQGLTLIREVTDDAHYKNSNLARR